MPRRKESSDPKKDTPKKGTPNKRTPEVRSRVLQALRVGVSYEEAATYAGIHRDTLNEWKKADSDFSDDCKKARASMEVESLAIIAQAGRKSWQARAWMLERMFPDRYSRRVMLGGGGGAPIQIDAELRAGEAIRNNKAALRTIHDTIASALAGAAVSTDGHSNGKARSNGSH